MRVSALKRWHWILIALAVGLLGGWVRQSTTDFEDHLDTFGKLMSQRQFEEALVGKVEGIRQFKDVTVYPYEVRSQNGSRRLVHIVAGRYWNGEVKVVMGQGRAHFDPYCYLAAVPYRPLDGGKQGTVLDYLDQLHKTAGVQYRYAWWGWAATPFTQWVFFSLVLIGGVWPTIINLLTFGSFSRPREEKGVSLLHVKAPPPKPAPAPITAGHLAELDHELEDHLAGHVADDEPSPGAPARQLSAGPLEPATVPSAQDDREFGADKDDFYPTERHRPHHPNQNGNGGR